MNKSDFHNPTLNTMKLVMYADRCCMLICFAPCLADFCLNNFALWPCLKFQWDYLSPAFVSVAKTRSFKGFWGFWSMKQPKSGSTVALRQRHSWQFHLHKHVQGICKIGFAVFCLAVSSYNAMLVSLLSWLDIKLYKYRLKGPDIAPCFWCVCFQVFGRLEMIENSACGEGSASAASRGPSLMHGDSRSWSGMKILD